MKIGIFAKTFAAIGAEPNLEAVRAAGYEAAQFNFACLGLAPMPDVLPPDVISEVARASAVTGIAIAAISGTYNMIHPDVRVRDAGVKRLELIIASARAMGTGLVTLCTGTRDPLDQWRAHPDNGSPEAWRDLTREMSRAAAIAERHGVDLGIEPELANVVSSAPLARKLIDEIGSPRLKIVLDPANLFETGSSASIIARATELLADRIAMAHAKDRRVDGSFCAAGSGVVDFPAFVRGLKNAGFDGPLITHGLSEAEAPAVARFLRGVVAEAGSA